MKERSKSILAHLILTIAGIIVGTLISGIIYDDGLKYNDVFGAIILSPLEMTLSVPLIFYRISKLVGSLVVFGFLIWTCSIFLRVKNKSLSNHFTLTGAVFWSLGNIPVFWAYMSV